MALGIITGSGTYSLPGFEGTGPEPVATMWGDAFVSSGTFAGVDVLHVSRHEEGHLRLSNHVTHQANLVARDVEHLDAGERAAGDEPVAPHGRHRLRAGALEAGQ